MCPNQTFRVAIAFFSMVAGARAARAAGAGGAENRTTCGRRVGGQRGERRRQREGGEAVERGARRAPAAHRVAGRRAVAARLEGRDRRRRRGAPRQFEGRAGATARAPTEAGATHGAALAPAAALRVARCQHLYVA